MRSRPTPIIVAVASLVLTISACGSDDAAEQPDGGATTSDETTGDGEIDVPVESSTDLGGDGTSGDETSGDGGSGETSSGAESSGEESSGEESGDPTVPRPPLLNAGDESAAYTGIAQIDGFGSACTGFVLDVGAPEDPPWLMTNGHCVGLFDATTVLTDDPTGEEAVARFRLFSDTREDVVEVPITSVAYGSMRATDVAIVALDGSRADLEDQGIVAYALGPPPAPGDGVRVVGVPVSGVDPEHHVLRGGDCVAGEVVGLVEWEWRWDAAINTDCKGILGGNSGSPTFSADDPTTVVGIINTTTIGATEGGSCHLGQPCEIVSGAATERADRTYAMPVDAWVACWPDGTALDLDADGCPAERPPIVSVDAPIRAVRTGATWSATIGAVDETGAPVTAPTFVTKTGLAADVDCRESDGYAPLVAGANPAVWDDPLPDDEGIYILCVAVVEDGRPRLSSAGYAVMEVDVTPPIGATQLAIIRDDGGARIDPIFTVPERSDFRIKAGPRNEIDCAVEDDYQQYRRIPIQIPPDEIPATMCVIASDEAGNQGPPETFPIE